MSIGYFWHTLVIVKWMRGATVAASSHQGSMQLDWARFGQRASNQVTPDL